MEGVEIIGNPPFKIVGVIIAMMGLCGLIFVLANTSLSTGEKIPLGLFSLIIMIIGIAIDTPLLGHLKKDEEHFEFDD